LGLTTGTLNSELTVNALQALWNSPIFPPTLCSTLTQVVATHVIFNTTINMHYTGITLNVKGKGNARILCAIQKLTKSA